MRNCFWLLTSFLSDMELISRYPWPQYAECWMLVRYIEDRGILPSTPSWHHLMLDTQYLPPASHWHTLSHAKAPSERHDSVLASSTQIRVLLANTLQNLSHEWIKRLPWYISLSGKIHSLPFMSLVVFWCLLVPFGACLGAHEICFKLANLYDRRHWAPWEAQEANYFLSWWIGFHQNP